MGVTKPFKFIRFVAVDVTKPYKFIKSGAMGVTKPYKVYKVLGKWVSPNHIKSIRCGANGCHQTF